MQRQRQPRNAWSHQKTEEAILRGSVALLTRDVRLLASRTESKFLLSHSTVVLYYCIPGILIPTISLINYVSPLSTCFMLEPYKPRVQERKLWGSRTFCLGHYCNPNN